MKLLISPELSLLIMIRLWMMLPKQITVEHRSFGIMHGRHIRVHAQRRPKETEYLCRFGSRYIIGLYRLEQEVVGDACVARAGTRTTFSRDRGLPLALSPSDMKSI